MRNRHDDRSPRGRSPEYGEDARDRPWQSRAREPFGDDYSADQRHWNRDEDMGGSEWSGASGRGGMSYGEHAMHGYGATSEGYGGAYGTAYPHFSEPQHREMRDMRSMPDPRDPRFHEEPRGYGHPRRESLRRDDRWGTTYGQGHGQPSGFGSSGTDMGFGDEDRGPFYGKGPKGYKRSDARIHEEVCEAIAQQGFIDASDVEIHVDDGVVKLTGTVAHRQDKRVLEQMIERVHGIDEIHNEIRMRRDPRDERRPTSEREPRRAGNTPNGNMPNGDRARS
jgi:hypothetical protein